MLVLLTQAHAQPANRLEDSRANYVQTVFNSRRGLPQDTVHAIVQGTNHFLWFATEEGFARYDGVHAETYDRKSNPELSNNIVTLAAAPDGSIWLATPSSVIHFLNGRVLSRVYTGEVRALLCDERGNVWVGTQDGLGLIAQNGRSLELLPGFHQGLAVLSILQDRKDGLWLRTSDGLMHFAQGVLRGVGHPEGMPIAKPSAMLVAADASLWLAGDGELLHWSSGSVLKRISLRPVAADAKVTTLLQDASGEVWIGFKHHGVAKLRNNALLRYTTKDGLPSDDVAVLQQDETGNIWVGLSDEGAVSLHAGLFRTYGEREGLGESKAWTTLAARDGSVWIGLNTKGLDHLRPDGQVDHYAKARGFPSGAVLALLEDDDRSIWAGLDSGDLVHVTPGRIRVYPDAAPVKAGIRGIARGPGRDLYVLYRREGGLTRFQDGHFVPEKNNVPYVPTFLANAVDGSLWIGSERSGITHWKHSVLASFGLKEGLPAEYVSSIYIEKPGVVWVATTGGLGLVRQGRVTTITPENGLHSYTVGSVLPDMAGYLWLSSNKGISKVRRQDLIDFADGKLTQVQSVVYGTTDGMRNAECNYGTSPSASRAQDGRLWYATAAGATSIDPAHSSPYEGKPEAAIESLTVDGKPFPIDDRVQLSKGAHDLQVNFTAPDFLAANHLRFRYKLEGFDTAWNEAGTRRQAFYTHLPPGDYTLLVQAKDGPGWPGHSSMLAITLPPYFWQTAWFRAVCGLSFVLIGYGIYSMRVYSLRNRGRMLQECVVQRTAELQEAIRVAEAAQLKLREQATLDSLTRLWNRSHIFELLQREAARAERERLDLCVLMLDVDYFKHINDSVGHLGGDRVLEQIAAILVEQTREYDYAGRYGGEEFLVILCNCTLEAGLRRSEAIRAAIASAHIEYESKEIPVSASFGVAEVIRGRGIEQALKEADLALYRAKHLGKNRVCSSRDHANSESGSRYERPWDYAV